MRGAFAAVLGAAGGWGLLATAALAQGASAPGTPGGPSWEAAIGVPTSIGAVCLWLVYQLKLSRDEVGEVKRAAEKALADAKKESDALRLAESGEYAASIERIHRSNKESLERIITEQREQAAQVLQQLSAQFERTFAILANQKKGDVPS